MTILSLLSNGLCIILYLRTDGYFKFPLLSDGGSYACKAKVRLSFQNFAYFLQIFGIYLHFMVDNFNFPCYYLHVADNY